MKKVFFIMLALAITAGVSAQQKSEAQAAINNIMTRTSIRQYTDETVSKADIETMLRAGMAAPTAVNRQPWHFVAVTDKAKLAELAGRRGGMIKQAVWTGCYPMGDRVAEVSKTLKLPETIVPLCVIAIGHPAEQPAPKDKWKPENVSYNEFGGKAE